ncbi:hypothetical protein ACHAWO_005229 [Cyclotella atomus]|uniref:Integrase catalytic domain-containing protein n=1 Tax=Cyclotella atomus TaxID=382360 RepID=A0ABD3P443_9STRA
MELRDTWARSVLDEKNQNLTLAQQECLLWHQRLSHYNLATVHNLCRQKKATKVQTEEELIAIRDGPSLPCTYNVPNAVCRNLLCSSCCIAKAKRRKPSISATTAPPEKEMALKESKVNPGDMIHCDHYLSPVVGRVIAASGHSSTTNGYVGGTIYVDSASGYVFHRPQKSISAAETIRGKLIFEQEAADSNVKVKSYHSDNGVFSSKEFREHCNKMKQKMSFSGVGAKFQNGVAENAIGFITNMARANMIHATIHHPRHKFINSWPLAMTYAIWCYNKIPTNGGTGWSPEELWTKFKSPRSALPRAHVFGCPVYVLDPKLQDGQKIPKWNSKARQGIFVGFSTEHSSNVPLVLNPTTGYISPQYHVIFDDGFTTVPSLTTETERNELFECLFWTAREKFVDEMDVEALKPELCDEWLSARELEARQRGEAIHDVPPVASEGVKSKAQMGDQDGVSVVVPEGESNGVPEGELEGAPSVESEGAQTAPSNPLSPLTSALKQKPASDARRVRFQNEARPSPPPPSPPTPPRRSPRHRKHETDRFTWKATLVAALGVAQSATSWAHGWTSPPAMVANYGSRHGSINTAKSIKHDHILELYMLQDDWTSCQEDVDSGIGEFAEYARPDLSDEIGSYTVTDVQPHILKAKAHANDADNPTFRQAMSSPHQKEWSEAIDIELNTLANELKAWTLVRRESWMKVLPMKWALKLKRYPDGLAKKFKARFCVRGDRQIEGIDYFETWAPVVQWTTVRTMLILAANQKLCTAQADITAAFVHAPLEENEEIYVEQPTGYVYGKPGEFVLKLNRSVYGIKQAPRNFFNYLRDHFETLGLRQSDHDPCLFVGEKVTAIVYVDDILFFARDDSDIDNVISALQKNHVQIRREGTAEGFLGVALEHTTNNGVTQIKLTQAGLAKRIVETLGLCSQYSTAISTPAEASPLPKDADGAPAAENFNYAAVVGMLLYLSGHSRPDIAFAVHQCARYTFNPTRKHEVALIRIGRYLKGTMDKGTIMTPSSVPRIDCYPDADFAGLYGHDDKQDPHCVRSRTGYVILAFGCPVLWRSKLQTEIALSTMEAEYVAISTACRDLFPVVDIVKELSASVGLTNDFTSKIHVRIHEDNVGALTLGKLEPRRMTPRSKHYAIKYHWFREKVKDKANRVELVKIDTKNQLGDIFTKGLTKDSFEYLRRLLMGW